MKDRRNHHLSRVGLRDRRICWFERRHHTSPLRILFTPVGAFCSRILVPTLRDIFTNEPERGTGSPSQES